MKIIIELKDNETPDTMEVYLSDFITNTRHSIVSRIANILASENYIDDDRITTKGINVKYIIDE